MDRFIDMLRRVQQSVNSARPILRFQRRIDDVEIGPSYPVARWLNDGEVSREQRQFVLSLDTRAQLFPKEGESSATVNPEDRIDCFYGDREALALSAARLVDGLPVSFFSDPCWDTAWLTVTMHSLDANANIVVAADAVRHASASEHIDVHAKWLQELTRIAVRDGRDLWDKRKELFPALELCTEVRGQLAGFKSGDPALRQIVKRLMQMQAFFVNWQGAPIGPDSLPTKCTPESGETMKKYANEHTFTRPGGQRVTFSWHVRFTPDPGRIFFDGDAATRKGLVGCIARDGLPTIKSPT
jgi:hypothetical protein